MSVEELLRQAAQAQAAGRPAEAAARCRDVLTRLPNHPDALHLLGLLAYQSGRYDVALSHIQQAIAVKDSVADYHSNLAVVLSAVRRHEEAIAACQKCLALRPDHVQGLLNLADALESTGRREEAVAAYRRALALRPDNPGALNRLGIALTACGNIEEAILAWNEALTYQGDYAEVYSNLALALIEVGKVSQAVTAGRRAVHIRPEFAAAHNNLGLALSESAQNDEARAAFLRALELGSGVLQTLVNLGNLSLKCKEIDRAISECRQALALDNNSALALYSLGSALREKGELDEAYACYQRALRLNSNYAEARNGVGLVLSDKGEFDAGIACYREALKLKPKLAMAHWNLSLSLLLRADFEHGWDEFEWRWKCKELNLGLRITGPIWDGGELGGRRIVLQSEQGFGDVIQFVRYIPQVLKSGGKVVLSCHPSLHRLLREQDWKIQECVPTNRKPPPEFDVQCPLMSLPLVFKTRLNSIPATVPYLSANEELVKRWKERMPVDGRLKVGLVWANQPAPPGRSPPAETWGLLAKIPGIWFCSLQKPVSRTKIPLLPAELSMTDWTEELTDFAETAALMANLDLIISVDTAVPHLAGAMGKPVWVLLKHIPDWRWMMDRADSPWYPTMRLYRQPTFGDWETPMKQLAEALSARGNNSQM